MRNTKRGSWYVEALTQVFSECACDMHVADMLVKVSPLRPPSLCARLRGARPPPPSTAPQSPPFLWKHPILRLWTLVFAFAGERTYQGA